MFTKQRIDDAVSPVVGVILMVAVTVILAAVIGSFVLDLGNNVQANPQAGVTFDQSCESSTDCDVTVQVVSMENADTISVQHDGSEVTDGNLDGVGQSVTVETLSNNEQVTVVGVLDGKEAVLQTYTVDA